MPEVPLPPEDDDGYPPRSLQCILVSSYQSFKSVCVGETRMTAAAIRSVAVGDERDVRLMTMMNGSLRTGRITWRAWRCRSLLRAASRAMCKRS
eukprot:751316-Pyramimonas_sp.AAC.1